jgi:hypothetical protein
LPWDNQMDAIVVENIAGKREAAPPAMGDSLEMRIAAARSKRGKSYIR